MIYFGDKKNFCLKKWVLAMWQKNPALIYLSILASFLDKHDQLWAFDGSRRCFSTGNRNQEQEKSGRAEKGSGKVKFQIFYWKLAKTIFFKILDMILRK